MAAPIQCYFRFHLLDFGEVMFMENYTKGEVKELEDSFELDMDENVIHMKVAAGSKIRNLMTYALKQMKDPKVKQITWNGSGAGTAKTITCAEILKRKIKGLHQITQIRFKRIEEYWEPKLEGLERLKVNRDVPAITILLSKTPMDPTIAGYQPPGSFDAFWKKGAVAAIDASRGYKAGRRHGRGVPVGQADSPAFGALTKKKKRRSAKEPGAGGGSAPAERRAETRGQSVKDSSPALPPGAGTPPDVDMVIEQSEGQ